MELGDEEGVEQLEVGDYVLHEEICSDWRTAMDSPQ